MAAAIAVAGSVALWSARPTGHDAAQMHAGYVLNPNPQVVCDTPEKFITYTTEHLGEPITASFAAGVTLVGWRTAGTQYDDAHARTKLLLARGPGDEPVVVLFQPASAASPRAADGTGLNRFRVRLGTIEAFEITPLSRPLVLPRLALARE